MLELHYNIHNVKKNILSFIKKQPKKRPVKAKKNQGLLQKISKLGPMFMQVLTAVIVFLIILVFFNYDLLDRLQDSIADTLLYKNTSDPEILIIAIDDKSLQEYGRWPWDRDIQAKIQEKLNYFNVKIVGWNITYFEPSDKDQALAESFNSDVPVILSSAINPSWQSGYVEPTEELQSENTTLGFVNLRSDKDGKIRSTPLYEYDRDDSCRKSFPLVMYEKYLGRSYKNPCETGTSGIPLENGNDLIINYAGPPGTIQTISVADFLEYDVIPESLKDKLVIVGVTAKTAQDYKLTPTSSSFMSSAEIMANALYTLKNGNFIYREDPEYVILGIFIVSAIIVFIMRFQKSLFGSIITFGVINIYILFAIWQFSNGMIMDIIYLPLAGITAWITQLVINFYINTQSELYIRGAFEHYVSRKVLNEIIKDQDKLSLGGETKVMTVLFSDIRKFTSLAEKMSAKKLVNLTNKYLNSMSNVILDNDGYIDKFIGDEIMAFWGAPIKDKDHAYNACITAINMMKELNKWKKEETINKKSFNMGIGINTGSMVVGNIGSEEKFSYTVLGDSVNLGSRLEELTKLYKVPIIISDSTYKQLKFNNKIYNPKNPRKKNLVFRELDTVQVKGRKTPVKIYELIGQYKTCEVRINDINKFENALKKYRNGKWTQAEKDFRKLEKKDPAVKVFLNRLENSNITKTKNWNGVWIMHKKRF